VEYLRKKLDLKCKIIHVGVESDVDYAEFYPLVQWCSFEKSNEISTDDVNCIVVGSSESFRYKFIDASFFHCKQSFSIDTEIYIKKTVSVCLSGGLGNRLFQIAFLYAISRRTRTIPVLYENHIYPNKHSSINYSDFYNMFKIFERNPYDIKIIQEPLDSPAVYFSTMKEEILSCNNINFIFNGYFQTEKYFKEYDNEIIELFSKILQNIDNGNQSKSIKKYSTNIDAFIHMRGGDHVLVSNKEHNMIKENLNIFYKDALEYFPQDNIVFTIISDDLSYVNQFDFLKSIKYTVNTHSNEIRALNMMISSTYGGICSNSTFSWWGSYLMKNKNDKKIIMPHPFLNKLQFNDIYFKGAIQISIKEDSVFQNICNVRVCNNQIIIIIVSSASLMIETINSCFINDIPANINVFDKNRHLDQYNDYAIITCQNDSFVFINNKEYVRIQINGIEKRKKVQRIIEIDVENKFKLVAMTMFKSDSDLIESYVSYYKKYLGIEHFFMYFNGNEDEFSRLPKVNDVTYIQWNFPYRVNNLHYAQIGALNDFLYWSKHMSDFVLFNDLDEYIQNNTQKDIKLFLQNEGTEYDCFGFLNKFICLGNTPFKTIQADSSIYTFIEEGNYISSKKDWPFGVRSKCIIRSSAIESMGIHKIISPIENAKLYIFPYEQASLLHVCNFNNRVNISLDFRYKHMLFNV
jgi:hypothetical protein